MTRAGLRTYYLTNSGNLGWAPGAGMRLLGASKSPPAAALDLLPGYSNYLRGRDPALCRRNAPQYGRVRFNQVYPGIDLIYHGEGSGLEYDFIVAPGASPQHIVLDLDGARGVRVNARGDLLAQAGGQELRFQTPHIFQGNQRVEGGYRLLGRNRVTFRIGHYNRKLPLIIDPVLSYSALFGDQGQDRNIYIAGTTASEIPLMNPVKASPGNCVPSPGEISQPRKDIFVAKLDPSGPRLLYSTYLGGDQPDAERVGCNL